MKTTNWKAVSAYVSLTNMGTRMMPASVAHKLYTMKKALENTYEFYSEEEKKCVTSFGGNILDNGAIVFKDPSARKSFDEKRKELRSMEIELTIEPQTVMFGDIKEATIEEIESLEGFVNFK